MHSENIEGGIADLALFFVCVCVCVVCVFSSKPSLDSDLECTQHATTMSRVSCTQVPRIVSAGGQWVLEDKV